MRSQEVGSKGEDVLEKYTYHSPGTHAHRTQNGTTLRTRFLQAMFLPGVLGGSDQPNPTKTRTRDELQKTKFYPP